MPSTRNKDKQSGMSGSDSDNKRKRLDEALPEDSDDELIQPKKAIKGKYGKPLRDIFQAVLEMVDKSTLPYFRSQVHNAQESFEDFINWLFATHRNGDEDSFIASDNEEEEEEGGEEEQEASEAEMEEEEETEEDSDVARKMEEEVVSDSQDSGEVEEEEPDQYDDDEEDAQ